MRAAGPLDHSRVGGDGCAQGVRVVSSSHGVHGSGRELGVLVEQGGGVEGSLPGLDAVRRAGMGQEPVDEVRLLVRGAGLNGWPEVPVDRLHVLAELGPAREAVALGNGELGAAELGVGVGRLALPVEIPGLVAQVLQARSAWQVARCHDTPLGHACVRISGPRRVSVGHCCRAQVGSALPADRVRPARSCERSSAPRRGADHRAHACREGSDSAQCRAFRA